MNLLIIRDYNSRIMGVPLFLQNWDAPAAIQGLKAIKYPCQVEIHTDSQYLIKVMTGGKRKANTDLLSTLDELCQTHEVSWVHVKGHSGNEMNERCDQLAKKAATAIVPQPTN